MAYIEKIKRKDKVYYYASKNFRKGPTEWEKIRVYIGTKTPSKKVKKEAFDMIDQKALERGLGKRSKLKYLEDIQAEKLEDIKDAFKRWYKDLPSLAKEKYDEDFLIRFTYNTNAIEGNRLSLRETMMILEKGYIPSGSEHNDVVEALNSRDAFEFIKGYKRGLNRTLALRVQKEVTKDTKCRLVGAYRDSDVRISGSDWIPPGPKAVPDKMKDLFVWYNNNKNRFHPVELGAIVHLKFVQIHPFVDGNGRTARLLMNWILDRAGYPMFFIENKKKQQYYDAIEAGDEGEVKTFVIYIANRIIDQFVFVVKDR